jgi:hypothetical protein
MAPCCPATEVIDPIGFIDNQVDLLLRGMLVPGPTA